MSSSKTFFFALLSCCAIASLAGTGYPGTDTPNRTKIDKIGMEISPFQDSVATVWKDGEKYMDLDLRPFCNPAYKNEFPPQLSESFGMEGLHPLSPDGRYIPIVRTDRDALSVIVLDLHDKSVFRREISPSFHFYSRDSVEWVTSTKFVVNGIPNKYLVDLSDPTASRPLISEYGLTWNASKENSASIYGKAYHHMEGSRIAGNARMSTPEQSWQDVASDPVRYWNKRAELSEAIKYDGRFVYPLEAQGCPGELDYSPTWADAMREKAGPIYDEATKTVKEGGVVALAVHIFSEPTFVADSPWMACLEQVYIPGLPDRQIECNLLLIDAHLATTVPPQRGEVRIVRQALDPLVPKTPMEYENMVENLVTTYDATSKILKIGRRANKLDIYEIPVEIKQASDGTFEPLVGSPVFLLKDKDYSIPVIKDNGGPDGV